MALLNIIKKDDDTLRKVCRPVEKISPRILTLLDDMKDTLIDSEGVGLAAPQVGILRR
ncbi:MAG: peptide deformylase, partial [Clostridia bacterium]|nr:peptide deformylase [Clostridia bacterium]